MKTKKYKLSVIFLLVISLFLVSNASAATVTLLDEGFEGDWAKETPPTGWTTNSSFWDKGPVFGSPSHTGDNHSFSWLANESMITPELEFQDNTELRFWHAAGAGGNGSIDVYVNDSVTRTLVLQIVDNTLATYTEAVVDLSNYTGTHTIEFVCLKTDFFGVMIDDVTVTTGEPVVPQQLVDVVIPFVWVCILITVVAGLVESLKRF